MDSYKFVPESDKKISVEGLMEEQSEVLLSGGVPLRDRIKNKEMPIQSSSSDEEMVAANQPPSTDRKSLVLDDLSEGELKGILEDSHRSQQVI